MAKSTTKKYRPFSPEYFWDRVQKGDDDACWLWTKYITPRGYGKLRRPTDPNGYNYAHRVAYELTHGIVPPGMHVCHSCDNPPCCNPAHLWLGTAADNAHDRDSKGRGKPKKPKKHRPTPLDGYTANSTRAKINPVIVREIRNIHQSQKLSHQAIGAMFGITGSTVGRIIARILWKQVQS